MLAFKGNGGKSHCCNHGDRVPDIALNKNGDMRFINSVSGNANYKFTFNVDLNRWYTIIIEQKTKDGKVTPKILLYRSQGEYLVKWQMSSSGQGRQ